MHCVQSVGHLDVNKLLKRSLACFCPAYIRSNWKACETKAQIGPWELELLNITQFGYVYGVVSLAFKEDDQEKFGLNGKYFASTL